MRVMSRWKMLLHFCKTLGKHSASNSLFLTFSGLFGARSASILPITEVIPILQVIPLSSPLALLCTLYSLPCHLLSDCWYYYTQMTELDGSACPHWNQDLSRSQTPEASPVEKELHFLRQTLQIPIWSLLPTSLSELARVLLNSASLNL